MYVDTQRHSNGTHLWHGRPLHVSPQVSSSTTASLLSGRGRDARSTTSTCSPRHYLKSSAISPLVHSLITILTCSFPLPFTKPPTSFSSLAPKHFYFIAVWLKRYRLMGKANVFRSYLTGPPWESPGLPESQLVTHRFSAWGKALEIMESAPEHRSQAQRGEKVVEQLFKVVIFATCTQQVGCS